MPPLHHARAAVAAQDRRIGDQIDVHFEQLLIPFRSNLTLSNDDTVRCQGHAYSCYTFTERGKMVRTAYNEWVVDQTRKRGKGAMECDAHRRE
jgi:hypothetical protein